MDTLLSGESTSCRAALVRAPQLTQRVVDGELVIYDPGLQRVHALNATAAAIWSACDELHDSAQIVDFLVGRYPESRDLIEEDVHSTVERFLAEGLLRAQQ